MKNLVKILKWTQETDMKTISIAMLRDWVREMITEDNDNEEGLNDISVLKCVSSYLQNQINPEPSVDLETLKDLHPEDLEDIPLELFKYKTYSKEEIITLSRYLSDIIEKMEYDNINNIN